MRRLIAALAITAASIAVPSTAKADARFYVRVGPPLPFVEVHAVAPHPGYVWVGGYHRWESDAYHWVPGRWELPPRYRTAWVDGHWAARSHYGWYWVGGHWR